MMIGGILGSMCLGGVGGVNQLVAAGAAIFAGVVLVGVGFMQSVRR